MITATLDITDPITLFSEYLRVTGVAHVGPEQRGAAGLLGKRLGLLNGASWITLWSNYFGRLYLPGVHLINVGNEAVQINFMEAHARGETCPPQPNIAAFARYATDLVTLADVDAVVITCSTMNRSYSQVAAALAPYGTPLVQIDRPMMERAVMHGGRILVVATHGPTVKSTQTLLSETAEELGQQVEYIGVTVEEAWERLATGDIRRHNQILAGTLREWIEREEIDSVVLAQLSMSALLLSYPDPLAEFGVPILTSAQCGFERVRELLEDA